MGVNKYVTYVPPDSFTAPPSFTEKTVDVGSVSFQTESVSAVASLVLKKNTSVAGA